MKTKWAERPSITDYLALLSMVIAMIWVGVSARQARAEVLGSAGISATDTGATVTMSRGVATLTLINDAASANEAYFRVFWCGEPTGAATTASPIRLQPGESIAFTYEPKTESSLSSGTGYCHFSYICAGAETATIRWVAK